ncbi:phosphonate C-P lyase system protein PhnH [Streptomyces sp. 110]|uniref:Phosphonate C-P lyase system protein PhnH n=1 Tax=Streptomyces endocoffeicus TaxID=2898945 RepID=A0ABS1Q047_9ACTN|nr:phosphonate C-P lyase system protein PhnH [Streptomyces endocoffeicus]MBL1118048.1 phosphonate C-P lyase system protein PhnH [Streptomyces endocoffeicus]
MTALEMVPPPAADAAGTAELVTAAKLRPAQAQGVFRAVLDALARPGTVTRFPSDALGVVPSALLPVLALADLGTGVHILEEDGSRRWSDVVSVATNAPAVPLEKARLAAAVRPVAAEEIPRLARGTAEAPEDGAVLCLPVAALEGGASAWRLSGPGVPGERDIAPRGVPDGFVAARAEAVGGFPAGVDLLLATPDGRVMGLPRSTTVTIVANAAILADAAILAGAVDDATDATTDAMAGAATDAATDAVAEEED